MAFNLDNIVPWGRSASEYLKMFSLEDINPPCRILDCGAGPSSFNAEMTPAGYEIISCDPLYECDVGDIRARIDDTYDTVINESVRNKNAYVWDSIKTPDELGMIRMSAMDLFLSDFEKGRKEGRYLPASLPQLPFSDKEFDLALSSHFLFLYSDMLSLEFHRQAIEAMCKAAKEVRIFPLLALNNKKSVHLQGVISHFENGYTCEITPVRYEFQKGANEMLVVAQK